MPVKKTENEYQSVILILKDGRKLTYTGQAQIWPGEESNVVAVQFTEPKRLPDGCSFEIIENDHIGASCG